MNKFEISWSSLWRVFLALILVAALFLAREALIILFLAIVFSSALDQPVDYLERKKIPRILGVILIFIAALGILAFLLYTLVPIAILEFQSLLEHLQGINLPVFGLLKIPHLNNIEQYFGNFANVLFSGNASFLNIIASIFGGLTFIIATLVLSFYLAVGQRDGVERFFRTVLPIMYEDYVIEIYHRARKRLGLWLQGQLLLMLIVGFVVFLGLLILGVKYSLILGILAGALEIVPVVGPIFSGTIAFLAAVSQSFKLGLYVVILFVVVQQIENHLLVPLVMRKTTGINPVVVVISLLAGAEIAGFIGIILAVPAAVIIQEILIDWERRKLKTRRLETT